MYMLGRVWELTVDVDAKTFVLWYTSVVCNGNLHCYVCRVPRTRHTRQKNGNLLSLT